MEEYFSAYMFQLFASNRSFNPDSDIFILPIFGTRAMKQNNTLKPANQIGQTGHWGTVVLNFRRKKIYYIDSLGYDNSYIHVQELADFTLKLMDAINVNRNRPL